MVDHIEMRRVEKIPIKRLGYDLILDLFEEMEAEDVAELAKVDRKFRSILLQEPWRVFGKHIYEIEIGSSFTGEWIEARKWESCPLKVVYKTWLPGRPSLALLKRVRSAQRFTLSLNGNWKQDSDVPREDQIQILKTGSLANLNLVDELCCDVQDFSTFQDQYVTLLPTVMERARLNFYLNDSIAETLSMVISTRLANCKEISIGCNGDQYKEIHEGLARARFAMVVFNGFEVIPCTVQGIIRHIVTKGIPSTCEKAVVLVQFHWLYGLTGTVSESFFGFFSQFTDLHQLEGENREEIDRIRDIVLKSLNRFAIAEDVERLSENNLYYTKVDGVKKTIYVVDPWRHIFFAKNVPLD